MKIKTILTNEELKDILNLLKTVSFESGKKTAAGLTKNLKNNLEACVNDENYLKLSKILKSKIIKNKLLLLRINEIVLTLFGQRRRKQKVHSKELRIFDGKVKNRRISFCNQL